MLNALIKEVGRISGGQPRIYVTGQSLGGSNSSFAYAQLLFDVPDFQDLRLSWVMSIRLGPSSRILEMGKIQK